MTLAKFPKIPWLLIGLAVIGSAPAAHAQRGGYVYGTGGGTYGTGGSTGVRTGQGPLSQPIPPATSLANPNQNFNYQQTPNRPQNYGGPAQTNPPQNPFGVGPR